jgi:glycosyltransferase involved in cell wall biosynthesis
VTTRRRGIGRPKLIIVAPSAYLLGGVQTWLDYLVPGLEASAWDVTVLLVHGVHSDAHRYLQRHPFPRVRLVTNATGSREGRIRALQKAILSSDADLVLGVNIVDVYEAVARARGHRPALKVAMALHGLHPSFYEDLVQWRDRIDGVIATNRLAVAAAIRMSGIPANRACYAPCGVVIPDLPPKPTRSDQLRLLSAGRLDDEKRVLDLPVILRLLERDGVAWSLRVAGSGPAEIALRAALAEFGSKVEFVGTLDESGMRRSFYQAGAIALILSSSETGPLVAWEAMANGVAVVTSRFSGIGLEAGLRDGETCLIFPVGDCHTAAVAVGRLVDPAFRDALISTAFESVRQRYSRALSVRAWSDSLRRVLSLPDLPAAAVRVSPSSGRLDHYLGAVAAESVRQVLQVRFQHGEAGSEWPHSYGRPVNECFRQELEAMDQSGSPVSSDT